jgi:hypothetical protein
MMLQKRQPLTGAFKGCEHMGMFGGHGPKTIGAICNPANFSEVIEVEPGILGPRDGSVAADLVEPGCEPLELFNPVITTRVFEDSIPWIVIRVVGKKGSPVSLKAGAPANHFQLPCLNRSHDRHNSYGLASPLISKRPPTEAASCWAGF